MSSFSDSDSDSHESLTPYEQSKGLWVWTESKQVMTAAVERGWKTLLITSHNQELAHEWSSMTFIDPLFITEGGVFDGENKRVATVHEVSTPEELKKLGPEDQYTANVVDLQDWQVIPAENIVVEFQGCQKMVFAVSKCLSEAQLFLEALEQGLGGVVLQVEDVKGVLDRKEPVHAYVAIPGGKTCYLSDLKAGNEVIVVNQKGNLGMAIVGRVKIETRPLILLEAKRDSDDQTLYSIFLQNAETVALVCPLQGNGPQKTAIPVTSLKVGDEILLRVQGGARHTGIEIK